MRSRSPVALAVLLALMAAAGSQPTSASPLRYQSRDVSFDTYCCWDFGGAFAFGGDDVTGDDTFEGVRADGENVYLPDFGVSDAMGRIDIRSGPLLSLSVTEDDFGNPVASRYEYGPGMLWAHVNGYGDEVGWSFAASLQSVTIDITCEPTEENDCFQGMAFGDVTAPLGAGMFSPEIAAALGIKQETQGGFYWMAIDYIEESVGDDDRYGGKNVSGLEVEASVPEPGLASVLLVGLGMAAWRRNRRPRRHCDIVDDRVSRGR
jgi:hypothetical protein